MEESPPVQLPVHVRPAREDDMHLIVNSWLKDYRDCAESWGYSEDEYYAIQKPIIGILLQRSNVAVACDPEDDTQVFGWVAWEDRPRRVIVHYIWTKFVFREMGVARQLWKTVNPLAKTVDATHAGPSSWSLRQAGKQFRVKPFTLIACVTEQPKNEEDTEAIKSVQGQRRKGTNTPHPPADQR